MNAVMLSASAAARPVVGAAAPRRTVGVVSRVPGGVTRGNTMHTVRAATLSLARSADDLRVGSSMTAASSRFRAAAAVDTPAAAARGTPRSSRRHAARMCGIIGIHRVAGNVSAELYEGLLMLQHRGQDSAGMVTYDGERFREKKDNGLVANIFDKKVMDKLEGSVGIGHVRYPTAGGLSASEAQPFFVNSPLGIYLIHNGNLTNTAQLLQNLGARHMRTSSDSEVLLNVLAEDINAEYVKAPGTDMEKMIFDAVTNTMKKVKGAYSVITMVNQVGLFAFRDPFGIRPLVLGQRKAEGDKDEWCIASEDSAFGPLGFTRVRDVNPGEAILITSDGKMISRQCVAGQISPCIFEYIYLARPDSTLNGISVYEFQLELGRRLAKRIKERDWEIDVIVPVPDGSRPSAIEIASYLDMPYREGLVKNRYVGRTFIMPDQRTRELSVRRKLNAMRSVFNGKKVLLVDDSIVRGTTMTQIVQMCRNAGAVKVYLASAAPPVKHPNVYGVDMPSRHEFVAHERDEQGVCDLLGADGLIYQTVEDMLQAGRGMNPQIERFDASCFDANYVTGDIDEDYLQSLEGAGRGKGRKGASKVAA
eukprot:CAMPEP_0197584074 /NCGR_PEP_ID=MMETSP1326-20131121/6790_1 /TAXON_ID=1155430 /ORGANISM="Genus nov. species nov., Strain RCC2288" /LENGTH=590 /DNA_ID=CAMNT_0043148383 /DNA_START=207 /DNA_END=1979 /DNA_ORIENTATION=+